MSEKVKWLDYEFSILNPDADWSDVGGVYIFCGINPKNQWQPFYIGKADNFRKRFSSHEVWDEAVKLGATRIHAMVVENEEKRAVIEKSLIETWNPPLNTHYTS